ncbi:type VI secretion system tube protein TssD [Sulfurimonas sp.]|uniref:type VI secretion system tube protein TssD n=1 Tax=Sulfurimonas sp. TaxID=2022749 RepID=UPI002B4A5275|nr:type VI secretion system tube protein TssD [Sulfurimonas sp.]
MNNIFISIKGSSQGLISHGATTPESIGNCHVHNHENEILVKSFRFGASNVVHAGSGKVLGQGRSKPLVITKMTDKSSPLLFNATTKSETLPEVVLKAYRTAYNGKHEHYLTITLRDALIANIDTNSTIENNLIETIYFVYKEITFEHVVASTVSISKVNHTHVAIDKPLLDRIFSNAVDNFIATNAGLYELGGGVVNVGLAGSSALSNYMYNKNQRHIFFKESRSSLLKIASLSLFQFLGLRRKGFNFRSLGPMQGTLTRAVFPMLQNAFYFEAGVALGSMGNAVVEEVYKDLYKMYLREYGESE